MASEIRVNQIQSRTGVSTISFTETGPIISGVTTITGDLDVAGLVSYDDVTNIDSVGLITARDGLHITGGSLGIGDESPTKPLTVGTTTPVILLDDQSSRTLEIRGPSTTHVASILTTSGHALLLGTNNTERLRITYDGNLGINQNSPSEKLEVYAGDILLSSNANGVSGGIGPNAALKFEYNGHQYAKIVGNGRDSSGYGDIDFYTSTSAGVSNLTKRMTIRADGKIGIGGLTNPGALLSIPAGESNTPRLAIESAVDDNDFTITQYEDGNGTYTMLGQNVKLNSGGNNTILDSGHRTAGILLDARNHGSIVFLTGGANAVGENVKIDSSGHVRVNTGDLRVGDDTDSNAGSQTISVGSVSSGSGGIGIFANPTNGNSWVQFGDGTSGSAQYRGYMNYQHADDSLRFGTASSEKLRITSGGDVVIGNPSAADGAHFQHYQSAARHQSFQSTNGDLAIVTDNNNNPAAYIKGTGTADLLRVFDNTTQIFTIKDGGLVTTPRQPSFGCIKSGHQYPTSGQRAVIAPWTEHFDQGSNFNATTGVFTAPVAGKYYFYVSVMMDRNDNGDYQISIYRNGSLYYNSNDMLSNSGVTYMQTTVCGIVEMSANDTVDFRMYNSTATSSYIYQNHYTHCGGYLIG